MPPVDGINKGNSKSLFDLVFGPVRDYLYKPLEIKVDGQVYTLFDNQPRPHHPLLNPIRNNSLSITALPNPMQLIHTDKLPGKEDAKIVTLSNGENKLIFPPEFYKADFSKDVAGVVENGDRFWEVFKYFGDKSVFQNIFWGRDIVFTGYLNINPDVSGIDTEGQAYNRLVYEARGQLEARFGQDNVSFDKAKNRFIIFGVEPVTFVSEVHECLALNSEMAKKVHFAPESFQLQLPDYVTLRNIYRQVDTAFKDRFNHPDGGILEQQNIMWGKGRFHSIYVNFNLSEINKKFGTAAGDFVLRLVFDGLNQGFGEGRVHLNSQGTSFVVVDVDQAQVESLLKIASEYINAQIVNNAGSSEYQDFAEVRELVKTALVKESFGIRLSTLVGEVSLGDVFEAVEHVKTLLDQKKALKSGVEVPQKLKIGSDLIEAEIAHVIYECWPEVEKAIKGSTSDYANLYAQELRSLYDPATKTIAGVDPKKVNAVLLLGLMQLDKESISKAEFMQDHYSDPVVSVAELEKYVHAEGKVASLVEYIEGQQGYVGKAKYQREVAGDGAKVKHSNLLDSFLGRLERDPHGYGILDKMDGKSEKGLIHQFWDKVSDKKFVEAKEVYFQIRQKIVDYYFQSMVSHYNPSITYVSRNDPQAFEKVWDRLIPFGKHVYAIGIEGDNFYSLNDVRGGFDDAEYRAVVDGITHFFEKHIGIKPNLTLMRAGDTYIFFVAMPEVDLKGKPIADMEAKIEVAKVALRNHFKTKGFQPRNKVSVYEFKVQSLAPEVLTEVGLKLMRHFELNVMPLYEKGILYLPTEDANGVKIAQEKYERFLLASEIAGSSTTVSVKRLKVWRHDGFRLKITLNPQDASIYCKGLLTDLKLAYSPIYQDGVLTVPKVDAEGKPVDLGRYMLYFQERGASPTFLGRGEAFVYGPEGVIAEHLVKQCKLGKFHRSPTVSVNLTGLNLANFSAFKTMVENVIPDNLDDVKALEGQYKDGFQPLPFKLHTFYSLFLPVLDALPEGVRRTAHDFILKNVKNNYFYYPIASQYMSSVLGLAPENVGTEVKVAESFQMMRDNISRLAGQFGVEPMWLVRMLAMSQHDTALFQEWIKDSGVAHKFQKENVTIEELKKQMWDIVDSEDVEFRKNFEKWFQENWKDIKFTKAAVQLMQKSGIGDKGLAVETLKSATPNVAFSVMLILFMESIAEHAGYHAEDHPVMHLTTVVAGQEFAGEIEKRVVAAIHNKYNPGSPLANMPLHNFSTMRLLAQKCVHFMRGLGAARLGGGITGELLQTFGMSPDNMFYHGLTTVGAVAPAGYAGHYFNSLKQRFAQYGLVHPKATFWSGIGVRLSWAAIIGMGIDLTGNYLDPYIHGDIEAHLLNQQYAKVLEFNRKEGLIASFFSDRDVSFWGRVSASMGYFAFNMVGNNISSWVSKKYLYFMDKNYEKSLNMEGAVRVFVNSWSSRFQTRLLNLYKEFEKKAPSDSVVIPGFEGKKVSPADLFVMYWNESIAHSFLEELKKVQTLAEDWEAGLKLPGALNADGTLDAHRFKTFFLNQQ